jgi:ribosome biogenesis GTPase / thiamine phosphate phosphatase
MEGKIIKGIAGFYYVHAGSRGIYECKAKGIFRNQNVKPLVGDNVLIEVIDEDKRLGNVTSILERRNMLVRPNVANVDQSLIIFAATNPDPNLNLLDRFLIMMLRQNVDTIICFNKKDLVGKNEINLLKDTYLNCGYHVLIVSTYTDEGMDELEHLLLNKTTVLAGPSGVGKSSVINKVAPYAEMEIGDISKKLKRGKHTTRHSEIFYLKENTFIVDTPGFSSLDLKNIEKEDLKDYFKEFQKYEEQCQFIGCLHLNEPVCGVKNALKEGYISHIRYENYKVLLEQIVLQKKY